MICYWTQILLYDFSIVSVHVSQHNRICKIPAVEKKRLVH